MALRYIGNGAAVIGVPAHDLIDEQVEKAGGEAFILSLQEAGKPLYAKESARQTKEAVKEVDHDK